MNLPTPENFLHCCITVAFVLATALVANNVQAQVAVRIPDKDLGVNKIIGVDRQVWLATNEGPYRIIGDNPQQITLPIENNVKSIEHIGTRVFLILRGGHGVMRVDGETVTHIENTTFIIESSKVIDERLWFTSNSGGAFVIAGEDAPSAQPVTGLPQQQLFGRTRYAHIDDIEKIKGHIWLFNFGEGLYRIDGMAAHLIEGTKPDLGITTIKEVGGDVWFIAGKGAYRVENDRAYFIEGAAGIDEIEYINGQVWFGSSKGAYVFEDNRAQPITGTENLFITEIKDIAGKVWLGTTEGIYRVEGRTARPMISTAGMEVRSLEYVNGQILLGTYNGAYRIEDETTKPIEDTTNLIVNQIKFIGGHIYLEVVGKNTGRDTIKEDAGVYLCEGSKAWRIPDTSIDSHTDSGDLSTQVNDINGQAWLSTAKGAYRIDNGVKVSVTLASKETWWKSLVGSVLPGNVFISGVISPNVKYERISDGKDPYGESFPKQFEIIMATDENSFKREVDGRRYSAANNYYLPIASGRQKIFIQVRDKWGNTFGIPPIEGLVVPGEVIVPILISIFWLALLSAVVALAPFSIFCHDLLMNPWVRTYGSFGLIPLAMTVFPLVKNHVFRRYLQGIREDEGFAQLQKRFVVPTEDFVPEKNGRLLEKQKKLLLLGQSGVGKTSYVKYLTSCYSSQKGGLVPKGVLPVFIPLSRYQGETAERMFHAQLSNYGRMTDKELTFWFLNQGGFVIFLDGLNEVDLSTRNKLITFVDQHWKTNFFYITSQQNYSEFSWIEKIELATLNSEKVDEFIHRRLEEKYAESIVNTFTKATYEIYSIPQDLELAIEVVKRGHPLPQSKQELYELTLAPIFDFWVQEGRADYPLILSRRAYEMLCSHDAFFDGEDNVLASELRDQLVEKRFLVRSANHYLFRHDLIRAYLAAKHFSPRWQELLKEKVEIDVNWRPMLEFSLLNVKSSEEKRDLLFGVLTKNSGLAGELFNWLCTHQNASTIDWTDDFKRKYGEAMLQRNL